MSSAAKKTNPIFEIQQGIEYQNLEMTREVYDRFAGKMHDLAGVDLPFSAKNHALLKNRLVKVLRRRQLETYEQYWAVLKAADKDDISEFVSALTTNMTSFFREPTHFDFLKTRLAEFFAKHSEVRIWCAAASTGQEPYTLAITICEGLSEGQMQRTRILATDIDEQVLRKASIGTYEEREMSGLTPALRQKYFRALGSVNDHKRYQALDQIHKLIRFAPFNLMNENYTFQHQFHVVICRNVLIYFDDETTKKVIDNLVKVIAPGGFLILGHSESGNVKHAKLKPMSRAIYQKI